MSSALAEIRGAIAELLARVDALIGAEPAPTPPAAGGPAPLAWGARVSETFRARVRWIGEQLGVDPSSVMTCIAWESGRSFRADVKNMAGSGATGLIQFMPDTAEGLHTTIDALEAMTPEDQLNFVYKYFEPFKGRLHTLADLYMAILWPKAVGEADGFVLWDETSRPTTYRQNAGLDLNRDGQILKSEAAAKVAALLPEGLKPGNVSA